MTRAKNLLIIMSDEHRKDAMGCAGHPIVKTPHLDALAARGTRFTNAYTPSPMCVPARAAVATGLHVHQCKNWDSATPYNGDRPSWMAEVVDAGMHSASIGKLHFRSTEDDNGFSEEILPMHVVGGIGWAIGLLRDAPPPYDEAQELAQDVGRGSSSYTDYDHAITSAAEDWIAARADGATPWAGFVSLVSPHYPLTAPDAFYDMYDPAEMDMPVAWREGAPEHPELQNIANFFAYDQSFDEDKMREAKVAYYGLTSFMDHCVGRVLAALEKSGQADDTLVIYVSDHGDMMGDQGFWTKQVMYDASAGVPMIAAGPGIPAGHQVSTGTSLLDLAATARDVAGLAKDDKPGLSLLELAGQPDDPNRTILSQYHDGGSKTGAFMVRWDKWKYIHYVGLQPQLFDLSSDPDELIDLSQHAESKSLIKEGERRLRDICDPEEINTQAFLDQRARINELGGEEACASAYCFNHTPVPEPAHSAAD